METPKIEEFYELLREALQARGTQEFSIEQSNVIKNNGVIQMGITLVRPGQRICPNIYIESYYEEFLKGRAVFSIADEIIEWSKKAASYISFDESNFMDYEKAKERIVFKLINREKNEKLLEQIPYKPYMDLAMVFYYMLPEECGAQSSDSSGTILIHNSHLNLWQITKEELVQKAEENTPRLLPAAIIGMGELLGEMLGPEILPKELMESQTMYVMSNAQRMNGAATMAYPQAVRNFAASVGKNVFIIPSSIHEVLLVPETGYETGLNAMVSEVNSSQLDPKEVLADHVYYYNRETDTLTEK